MRKSSPERKRKVAIEQRLTLGQNLRERRRYLNLTQGSVAEQLGITTTAYSKIERGESGVTVDRISDLSLILDMNINELISNIPIGGRFMKELYVAISELKDDVHAITTLLASDDSMMYGKQNLKDDDLQNA